MFIKNRQAATSLLEVALKTNSFVARLSEITSYPIAAKGGNYRIAIYLVICQSSDNTCLDSIYDILHIISRDVRPSG